MGKLASGTTQLR
ncbi:MAG: hypothetical protein GX457_13385 [Thermotogaceae bacterium]|nr:hypothetical protein [Thermotogaceae bacterium]